MFSFRFWEIDSADLPKKISCIVRNLMLYCSCLRNCIDSFWDLYEYIFEILVPRKHRGLFFISVNLSSKDFVRTFVRFYHFTPYFICCQVCDVLLFEVPQYFYLLIIVYYTILYRLSITFY